MLTLPPEIITLMTALAPLFSAWVFAHAQVLSTGAILTPGQRTVTAALQAMGLAQCRQFQNYHRVLKNYHRVLNPLSARQRKTPMRSAAPHD